MSAAPAPAAARTIPGADLHRFVRDSLTACGLPAADAVTVADLMLEADLTGADAHGIFRLPQYVGRLRAGGINPTPKISVERTGPATALVDGDNAMGHLVMKQAADAAVELARESGVGWVGARRSNHAGPAALYASIPLAAGMVGLYSAVASANHMGIWGGSEPLLGTNPLAVAIPAGAGAPVVLDMATTMVSYGTIKSHALKGRSIPSGWMIERDTGRPLTDPTQSARGLLEPIGGYKGSGLALVLGLLAGTLNGAAFGRDVVDFNADERTQTNTGHFVVALDVARFMPADLFGREVDRQIASLKTSERMSGVEAIRIPGSDRARRRAGRAEDGVPVLAELVRKLDRLAAELAVEPLVA